jgi:hypothetical protein
VVLRGLFYRAKGLAHLLRPFASEDQHRQILLRHL